MALTAEKLQKLHIGAEWVDALNETSLVSTSLPTTNRRCLLGQCSHECGNFRILEENLNYRAATLMKLWPKRFPTSGDCQCV